MTTDPRSTRFSPSCRDLPKGDWSEHAGPRHAGADRGSREPRQDPRLQQGLGPLRDRAHRQVPLTEPLSGDTLRVFDLVVRQFLASSDGSRHLGQGRAVRRTRRRQRARRGAGAVPNHCEQPRDRGAFLEALGQTRRRRHPVARVSSRGATRQTTLQYAMIRRRSKTRRPSLRHACPKLSCFAPWRRLARSSTTTSCPMP